MKEDFRSIFLRFTLLYILCILRVHLTHLWSTLTILDNIKCYIYIYIERLRLRVVCSYIYIRILKLFSANLYLVARVYAENLSVSSYTIYNHVYTYKHILPMYIRTRTDGRGEWKEWGEDVKQKKITHFPSQTLFI